MTNTVALFVLTAIAGTACAIDVSARPLDEASSFDDRGVPVFSAIGGPFAAFPLASGSLGFDDYNSIATGDYDVLTDLRFIGGVANVGGRLDFNFFHQDGTLISNFFVTLFQSGDFFWTISNINVLIPTDGILQIVASADTTGRWFLSQTAPTIGTQSSTFGGANGGAFSHRFELQIPAPGALALGSIGLLAMRRRRA
jgi:hypothetical protein